MSSWGARSPIWATNKPIERRTAMPNGGREVVAGDTANTARCRRGGYDICSASRQSHPFDIARRLAHH